MSNISELKCERLTLTLNKTWLFHGEDFISHDPTLSLFLIEITSAEITSPVF